MDSRTADHSRMTPGRWTLSAASVWERRTPLSRSSARADSSRPSSRRKRWARTRMERVRSSARRASSSRAWDGMGEGGRRQTERVGTAGRERDDGDAGGGRDGGRRALLVFLTEWRDISARIEVYWRPPSGASTSAPRASSRPVVNASSARGRSAPIGVSRGRTTRPTASQPAGLGRRPPRRGAARTPETRAREVFDARRGRDAAQEEGAGAGARAGARARGGGG